MSGKLGAVKYVVSVLSDFEHWKMWGKYTMQWALSRALQVNNVEVINYLCNEINRYNKDENQYSLSYDPMFSYNAARSGSVDVIDFLFKREGLMMHFAANSKNLKKEYIKEKLHGYVNGALFGACLSGRVDAVESVLNYAQQYEVDVILFDDKDYYIDYKEFHCVLIYAIKSGNIDVFNRIAAEIFKKNPSLLGDEFFEKAVLMAAKVSGYAIFTQVMPLISSDNLLDLDLLFCHAIAAGSYPILKYLLDKFPEIDLGKTLDNYNIWELAVISQDPATIIFIRNEFSRQGGDIERVQKSVLRKVDIEEIKWVLELPLDTDPESFRDLKLITPAPSKKMEI